jgi:hypothetical protein
MIRFKTKHHADVVMHDAVAEGLIKKMGASGVVPSALDAELLTSAIEKLTQTVDTQSAGLGGFNQESVSLSQRAKPLIDLLQTALRTDEAVMWQKTNSF